MTSRSRNVNNRHNENHGSRRIKHLFLVSQKIILQNHASRLLWKSRFTRKKISHFTFHEKKKGPITSHENTLYHPQFWCQYNVLISQSLINKHCNNALINSSSAQETPGHLLTLSVPGVGYSQFYHGPGTGD